MQKVVFDCDNTMGVKGKDVDDGLTLLYLLGRDDIELLGVTTTFGNSTIDIVHENTANMFKELNIKNIPLYKGTEDKSKRISPASEFLVNIVNKYPNEITILATGSLTNLYGAYKIDNDFFKKVKNIVLMGGITKPLIINGKNLDELNFSSDNEACYKVLTSGAEITIMTGHICLQAFVEKEEFYETIESKDLNIYKYIKEKTTNWFDSVMEEFGINGFYNWDIVAGVYITHPQLFDKNIENVVSTVEDLKTGYLKITNSSNKGYKINIPTEIKDIDKFNEIIFKAWENVNF
ncbi:nucleoside hydrolase [Thermohalobacter berrensis]|uniref:Nucleoside hydrolase n=1 Tax=Thermohalobacter berrensis TaxID=99594 RepID=A0A419SUY8_9FIRM|nr:nucleoside hydrolase [Thermohalobacter berrensis]RKD29031.1 nucleoside hydrolase [Thermohalobacter berrensis]